MERNMGKVRVQDNQLSGFICEAEKCVDDKCERNTILLIMRKIKHRVKYAGLGQGLIRYICENMKQVLSGGWKKEYLKCRGTKDKNMYYAKNRQKLRQYYINSKLLAVAPDKSVLTYFEVRPFSKFEKHSHENEQITCVLEGELYFETPDGTVKVRKGEVIAIPSNVEHSVSSKDAFVRAVDAWPYIKDKDEGVENEYYKG